VQVHRGTGHESSALALEAYAKVMKRNRDTGKRMDALVRHGDRALIGTSAVTEGEALPDKETEKAA
jgi:hypothetical protein